MSNEWKMVRLGDVCNILNGYAFKSTNYTKEGIRVMRIANVQKGKVTDDDPQFYPISYTEAINNYMLFEGDLLMSLTGNVGRVGILNKELLPAALNQRVACLRLKDCSQINLRYLYNFLNSDSFENDCIANSQGIAQKNMSTEWLKNYFISLPTIARQREIAGVLDKVSELVEKRKAQLVELDLLAESIFYDMFGDPVTNPKGWEKKTISEFTDVKIGPFGSLLHAHDYIENGLPVINPIHMQNGKITADYKFSVTDEKASELQSYFLSEGDIILGRRGDIGRCALVTNESNGYICGTGSLFIRKSDAVNPLYLLKTLSTNEIKDDLISKAKGATMLNINCGIVLGLNIILPPLPLQQQFAERIEKIEEQKQKVKTALEESENLFQRLMQDLFNPNL